MTKNEIKNFINVFSSLLIGILIVSMSLTVLGYYMDFKHQIYNYFRKCSTFRYK